MPSHKTTDGRWQMSDAPVYFAAVVSAHMQKGVGRCPFKLLAVGDVNESNLDEVSTFCDQCSVLLDSGVFSVAMRHAEKHNLSHDAALRLPLTEIDGFKELLKLYRIVVDRLRDKCWGYIEIDLGGREQKKKTRAMLEREGYRPIPVFHPLNDGWEYFDELASQYDRLCVGNLVKADEGTRFEILTKLQDRRRGKKVKWIHALGVSPKPFWAFAATESCDSTSWSSVYRYGGPFKEWSSYGAVDIEELTYAHHTSRSLSLYAAKSAGHITNMIQSHLRAQR